MIGNQPSVSVIVRTKDRQKFFEYAIRSVIQQTYRPIELVVVNDGGHDITEQLSSLLVDTHNIQLRYIHHSTNQGRSQAANSGLLSASSPLSIFLDDDDYFDSDHIANLVSASQRYFNNKQVTGAVHCRARAIQTTQDSEEHTLSIQGQEQEKHQLYYQNSLPILTVLFPTNVREAGVRFDSNFDLFEDWDFWLQVAQICDFHFLDNVSCAYRIHDQSSGARERTLSKQAYKQIYQKWLRKLEPDQLYNIMSDTHTWRENTINTLQERNYAELSRIGQLHSYALETIASKDQDISHLSALLQKTEHEYNALFKQYQAMQKFNVLYLAKHSLQLVKRIYQKLFTR